MVEYCVRCDARFWYHGRVNHGRVDLDKANSSSLANRTIAIWFESAPFEGSSSFQGLRGSTWVLVPALPYFLATSLQVQLARQYTTLMLQPSYPVHQLSQPRPGM